MGPESEGLGFMGSRVWATRGETLNFKLWLNVQGVWNCCLCNKYCMAYLNSLPQELLHYLSLPSHTV